jgi:phage baseplate assembly protein W
MATVVAQVTRKYKDLDLAFTMHPVRKDVNKHVDDLAVINSVKNLISTSRYERPFQPQLGSGVRGLLFEQMDSITASALKREIRQTLDNFEPRVAVQDVAISPDFDNNGFKVGMTFLIVNRTEPITIQFFLQRDR